MIRLGCERYRAQFPEQPLSAIIFMAVLKSKPKAKSTSNIPNNPKMAVFSLGAFCLKAYKYVYIYRDIEIYIYRERERHVASLVLWL